MKLIGGLFGLGKNFYADTPEEIEVLINKNKKQANFPVFGTEEKVVLIVGQKSNFLSPAVIKIIITNKRIILRTGIMKYDQYPYKAIDSFTTGGGLLNAFSPVIILGDGKKKINLFSHMRPHPKLGQILSAAAQEQWANSQ
jgi:hypothetical protein